MTLKRWTAVALAGVLAPGFAFADEKSDLAQELVNPLASIISMPFQLNVDDNIGEHGNGTQTMLNFQPVIPFGLENGGSIITRTIIPYVWRDDVIEGTSQSGFSDVLFSAWYTPAPKGQFVWGVGPVVSIPTGTDVSNDTWAAGITAIGLVKTGKWTIGGLTNHLWDTESNPSKKTNVTFLQPFIAYSTDNAWTVSLQSETTYDWDAKQWSVPINASLSKLVYFGKMPVNLQGGVGYWAKSTPNGPSGMRYRLQAQFVLPKG